MSVCLKNLGRAYGVRRGVSCAETLVSIKVKCINIVSQPFIFNKYMLKVSTLISSLYHFGIRILWSCFPQSTFFLQSTFHFLQIFAPFDLVSTVVRFFHIQTTNSLRDGGKVGHHHQPFNQEHLELVFNKYFVTLKVLSSNL